jgi:hypothetical protein
MACNFSIQFQGSADAILNRARSAVQSQGGSFTGDTNSGNFHVTVFGSTIGGSYFVSGQELNLVIDKKPFLIPCGTIEGYLKKEIGA